MKPDIQHRSPEQQAEPSSATEPSPLSGMSADASIYGSLVESRRLADAHAGLLSSVLDCGLLSVEELAARGIAAKTGGDTFVDEEGQLIQSKGVLIVVETLHSRDSISAEFPDETGWADESRETLVRGLLHGDGGAERSPPLVVAERSRPDIMEELGEGLSPGELNDRLKSSVIFVMRFDESRDSLEDRCVYRDGARTYGYDRVPPENIVAVLSPRAIYDEMLETGVVEAHPDKLVPVDGSVDITELVPYGIDPGIVTLPDWGRALNGVVSRLQSALQGDETCSIAIHAMRLDTRADIRGK